MSDDVNKARPGGGADDWAGFWQAAQQQYLDAWSRGMQTAGNTSKPGGPGGPSGMFDQWWNQLAESVPEPSQELFKQMLNQGRAYFEWAESLSQAGAQGKDVGDWFQAMNDSLESLKGGFTDSSQGISGAGAFWNLPLDSWQRSFATGAGFPDAGPEELGKKFQHDLNRFLSIPTVGYTRESQQQFQRLARLGLEYGQALQEYTAAFSQMGVRSVEALQQRLKSLSDEDKQVESMRELFNLWVDASEDVYAEYVHTEQYAQVYGNLVNALMAYKQQGRNMVDETLGAMNMPTRREVDTLHERLQGVRRQKRDTDAQLAEATRRIDKLEAQIRTQNQAPAPVKTKPATSKARP